MVRLRRIGGVVIVAVMAASAAYSANTWGLRDRFLPPAARLSNRPVAAAPTAGEPPDATIPVTNPTPAPELRSQPWWQEVATLRGDGPTTTEPFVVADHSLQWRVRWRCHAGPFRVLPVRTSGDPLRRPLADVRECSGKEDSGFSVRHGRYVLRVEAAGPWEMTVEQQVDVPMVEPPLPEMTAPGARVVRTATVYDVDRTGRGSARIYELPDGSRVLRLEDFFVSINSDLEILFSELAEPRTTPQIAGAPFEHIAFLKATAGSMNYPLPADLDLRRFGSIVIWCEITHNAYAAAALSR